MCMNALPEWMYVQCAPSWCLQGLEDYVRFPVIGITDGVSHHVGTRN